jgi:signal transduction histidine kinase
VGCKPNHPILGLGLQTADDNLSIFQALPGAYVVMSPDLSVTGATDAFLRATGTRREEILGKGLADILPGSPQGGEANGLGAINLSLQRAVNNRQPDVMAVLRHDLRQPDAAGGQFVERYWSIMSSPVLGVKGTASHLILALHDVTDIRRRQLDSGETEIRKRAQELELIVGERTQQLSETVAELESFCYSLSHDMRAPLRAIYSFTEMTLEEGKNQLNEECSDYLRRSLRAAQRLDRLIQDVLSYTRVSKQEIKTETVDVDELIRQLIEERPELQRPQADVQIEGHLAPMLGHEASLTQCLTNLLSNAVKFVPRGTHPRVRIYTEPSGADEIRLWIIDNGIGIDSASQRRLFQMFQRIHTGDEYKGTGLGLAIVRKSVERMAGKVGIESSPGQGSRFWVQFPKGTQ